MNNSKKLCKETKYFNLYEAGKGIYAAIENDIRQAGSNAGFVDMGHYTIVFDSFLNPDAAADLKICAEEHTGKCVSYVVNSHFHMDHILGNGVFDNSARIISSVIIREKILSDAQKSYEEIKGLGPNVILEIEEGIKNAASQEEAAQLKNDYKYISNIQKENAVLRIPEMVFQKNLSLYGDCGEVKLIAFEKAHSPEDVILLLPEQKLCFTGDLLFKKMHPWIGTGVPENYIKALEFLLSLDVDTFIPGHGEISTKEEVRLQIQYIKELLALADKAKQTGMPEHSFSLEDISKVFRDWDGLCYSWNLDFLMKRDGI